MAAGCGGSGQSPTNAAPTTTAPPTTTSSKPAASAAESPHQFSDFRIAMDEETDYLDPGLSDTTEGWGVMWNVYLPLLGYRHASGKAGAQLVPYLATSLPHISRDRRTYRLTLRKGLKYSDGSPVKASDFKKTVERDFVLDSAGADFFRNVVGAQRFSKHHKGGIRGIVVDDPKRIILIHLAAPQADFANVLASSSRRPCRLSAPSADTSLHPLPSTGPTGSRATSRGRGSSGATRTSRLALPRACPPQRDRVTGHRPERRRRPASRPERQGRLDGLLPDPEQAASPRSSRNTRAA
jgi:ABC-type transport system substrate-binding protein